VTPCWQSVSTLHAPPHGRPGTHCSSSQRGHAPAHWPLLAHLRPHGWPLAHLPVVHRPHCWLAPSHSASLAHLAPQPAAHQPFTHARQFDVPFCAWQSVSTWHCAVGPQPPTWQILLMQKRHEPCASQSAFLPHVPPHSDTHLFALQLWQNEP